MALIKTEEEIKKIEIAGRILASVLKKLAAEVKVGVKIELFDQLAKKLIREAGAEPAFLNYHPYGAERPYPCSLCVSINDAVVHGLPKKKILQDGDVVKLDIGVRYQGYYADGAITLGVGEVSEIAKKLMRTCEVALAAGLKAARAGNRLGDIGYAVQSVTEKAGFSVIKGLTGHGIGEELHEEPTVFNEGRAGLGMELKEGMVLAIEPMISVGAPEVIQLKDDSYAAEDGSLTAHFEHTVLITEKGPRILTN